MRRIIAASPRSARGLLLRALVAIGIGFHVAVGQCVEEGDDVVDLAFVQPRFRARMLILERRIAVEIGLILLRQIVVDDVPCRTSAPA